MSDEIGGGSVGFGDRAFEFAQDAVGAARKYPVEIALAIAMAVFLSGRVARWWSPAEDVVAAVGAAVVLAWLAAVALSSLAVLGVIGGRSRWALTATMLTVSGGYGYFLATSEASSEWWRWLLLVIAFGAGWVLTPVAASHSGVSTDERFWRFNARILARGLTCLVYAGLMYIGLALGLVAVDALLDTKLNNWYGFLAFWLFGAGLPWMMMAGFDEIADIEQPVSERPIRFTARFGSFLLLPLLILYLLIMYGHIVKIVFGDWAPSNVISPLVVGAGLLGYVGLFLLEPLRYRDDYRGVARFFQGFPIAFLPILPLSFWAIFERVNQYGWTEFRHFRLVIIVCLALVSLYGAATLLRKRPFRLFIVPALVVVLSVAGAGGPWSLVNMSRSSQLSHLTRLLKEAEALDANGRLIAGRAAQLDSVQASEIMRAYEYNRKHFGERTLERFETPEALSFKQWAAALATDDAGETYFFNGYTEKGGLAVQVKGEMYEFNVSAYPTSYYVGDDDDDDPKSGGKMDVSTSGDRVEITYRGQPWHSDLTSLRHFAEKRLDQRRLPRELRSLVVVDSSGKQVAQLLLSHVSIELHSERVVYSSLRGHIIIVEP
ncbi:MAG: DUF4153 domain-containing protein [Bradymonadaceae bacterium]|nr:DUF4153 domain-containing protein [Lujinxingiaceae bacterium]